MAEGKLIATPYDDLTYKIIGCAMAVHRQLGPSHRENIYQRDLQEHFIQAGLSFEAQKLYEVLDSLGNGSLIGYLVVTGLSVGLLINFGLRSLPYKRILPPQKDQEHRINRQWLFIPDWLKAQEETNG